MKVSAYRKAEAVTAIQFDGGNAAAIERELAQHTGRIVKPILTDDDRGVWIVLQPAGRWQTLPDVAFHRTYNVEKPRTCFDCVHYGMANGAGRCNVFEEPVDSEIVAARDCDAFDLDA